MDAYDLQARHAPVVFAFLPIILVVIVLVPEFGHAKFQAGSLALIIVAALAFVATRIARSAGRARQDALYAAWGGQPTTAMLRFRDTRINPQTKQIYRDRLRRLGAAFPIPDDTDEQGDPHAADIKIAAAMDEVRRRAKERQIKSVHRENINYGAARNAYGLKPYGLTACAIALLTLALVITHHDPGFPTSFEIAIALGLVVITGIWLFACTPNAVHHHAEAYALALYEAIEILVPAERKAAGRKGRNEDVQAAAHVTT
jgi:hypothetical protein